MSKTNVTLEELWCWAGHAYNRVALERRAAAATVVRDSLEVEIRFEDDPAASRELRRRHARAATEASNPEQFPLATSALRVTVELLNSIASEQLDAALMTVVIQRGHPKRFAARLAYAMSFLRADNERGAEIALKSEPPDRVVKQAQRLYTPRREPITPEELARRIALPLPIRR